MSANIREKFTANAEEFDSLMTEMLAENEKLVLALSRVRDWNEHNISLAVDNGSNGVRDYYRGIAREALIK